MSVSSTLAQPNLALLYALLNHLDSLSDAEKAIFEPTSIETLLDEVRLLDAKHASNSKARRYLDRFAKIAKSLEPFFAAIDNLVSSHPDIAALIWGGLRFVVITARAVSSFFEKITTVLEEVTQDLHFFHDYATQLYTLNQDIQTVLVDVYGDIIGLCLSVRRVFLTKKGKSRNSVRILWNAAFSRDISRLCARFRVRKALLERHVQHATRRSVTAIHLDVQAVVSGARQLQGRPGPRLPKAVPQRGPMRIDFSFFFLALSRFL